MGNERGGGEFFGKDIKRQAYLYPLFFTTLILVFR